MNNINSTNYTTNSLSNANQTTEVVGQSNASEHGVNQAQWPPLDLYQQIDALISNTGNANQVSNISAESQAIQREVPRSGGNDEEELSLHVQQQIMASYTSTTQRNVRNNLEESQSHSTLNEEQMNEILQTTNHQSDLVDSSSNSDPEELSNTNMQR